MTVEHDTLPEMPEDWWPDEIHVIGRDGDVELGFVMSDLREHMYKLGGLDVSLNGLRKAIWDAKQNPKLLEMCR